MRETTPSQSGGSHLRRRSGVAGSSLSSAGVKRSHRIAEISASQAGLEVRLAGRIVDLQAGAGGSIVAGKIGDGSGELSFRCSFWEKLGYERGDIVALGGEIVSTGAEIQLEVKEGVLLTKCLLDLPSRAGWTALPHDETFQQRELDLVLGTELGQRLKMRPLALRAIRHFLEGRGFLEVDTPHLVPWPDIAPVPHLRVEAGRHCRPGDLRIANTEFMRRLLVGGFERIYQIGRCFRDETQSYKHSVEFTQLTFGMAYSNYLDLMDLIEEMVIRTAADLGVRDRLTFRGEDVGLQPPWKRITVKDAVISAVGIDLDDCHDADQLRAEIESRQLTLPDLQGSDGILGQSKMLDQILDTYVVPNFAGPTFLYEYPFYLGGPAREVDERPRYKMRCELFIAGMEIANMSTPQNDPARVRSWYEEVRRLKSGSPESAPPLDEPYLTSMDLGIPISATGGVGFDRLLMLLLGIDDINNVFFFPSGTQYQR